MHLNHQQTEQEPEEEASTLSQSGELKKSLKNTETKIDRGYSKVWGLHASVWAETGFFWEVYCSLEAETLTENEFPPLIVPSDYILMLLVSVCSHRGVLIFLQR